MSSSSYLEIDWRNAPKTEQIMSDIRRLLVKCDAESEVRLRLESQNKEGVISLQQKNGTRMLMRRDHQSPRSTKTRIEYWARLLKMATLLIDMVHRRESLKMRMIQYREAGERERLDVVKRKMMDLALTVKIHPIAFGVRQEDSGKVRTPHGVSLESTVVEDIFEYLDRRRTGVQPKVLPGTKLERLHGNQAVPPLILSMQVKLEKSARVDAVIVVEHQNLSELDIKNVLLVMTAGFPSSAIKEFLHLLSCDAKLRRVPFLYFSDHDTEGMKIFQTLKYGSKNAAWGSSFMVCPRLEYAGPTRDDLKDSPRLFRPHWEARFRASHPEADDRMVEDRSHRWQKHMKSKVKRKFRVCTKTDHQTKKSFDKLGWLRQEPLVNRALNVMLGVKKGKFRLADMTIVDIDYLRFFIEAKLQQRCPGRETVPVLPPVAHGVRAQNTPSQSLSMLYGAGTQATVADAGSATAGSAGPRTTGREPTRSPEEEMRLLDELYIP